MGAQQDALYAYKLRKHAKVSSLGQAAGYDAAEVANALGLISALRSFSEFTAAPILASWSDRLGRKWALLLSSTAFVIEAALIAVSPGLLMMGIVHTLGGFLASNGAIETSCVADATPAGPKRAVAVGRFLTAVGAALVLGPFLGGLLLEHWGGRSPFAFAAGLGFVALLAIGFVPVPWDGMLSFGGLVVRAEEYLPPSRRSQSSSSSGAPVLAAFQLLVQNPALRWYTAASGRIVPATSALQEAGLSSEEVASSIHRMSQAAEEAVQRTAGGSTMPVPLLLSHCQSGELFACQISWRKNVHPTLGWSYYLGLVQQISKDDFSVRRLLSAATTETTYADLCKEAEAPDAGLLSERFGSEVHAAAEKMWKDELAKGMKPASSSTKRRDADMSSIWSRSTASTISSAKEKKSSSKVEGDSQIGSHHFGALLGMLPSSDENSESSSPEKQVEEPQLPTGGEICGETCAAKGEAFHSASEDEFEECETMSSSSSLSLDSGAALFDEVDDPVKHVDRARLRQMKQAGTIYLKRGLQDAHRLWKNFCDCFERQEFFKSEETGGGIALLENLELALPSGEFAFVQPFHGRLGNPIACLVYVKHVELDDCPFLVALHSYMPNDCGPDDVGLREEFDKLSLRLDEVISELASEFFYYAPMRRQRTFRTNRFSTAGI
eukprot:Skav223320  [mRNA]  locus=scaffold200:56756:69600:+ [translate_table: standard]